MGLRPASLSAKTRDGSCLGKRIRLEETVRGGRNLPRAFLTESAGWDCAASSGARRPSRCVRLHSSMDWLFTGGYSRPAEIPSICARCTLKNTGPRCYSGCSGQGITGCGGASNLWVRKRAIVFDAVIIREFGPSSGSRGAGRLPTSGLWTGLCCRSRWPGGEIDLAHFALGLLGGFEVGLGLAGVTACRSGTVPPAC